MSDNTTSSKRREKSRIKTLNTTKRNRLIFYWGILVLPLIQFVFCYIYVNMNTFVLAFQEYDFEIGGYVINLTGNFKQVFADMKTKEYIIASFGNSIEVWFWSLFFGSAGSILFSYYIYKKNFLSGFFKIILYSPAIVSGVIIVIIYKYFMDMAIPELVLKIAGTEIKGLLSNSATRRPAIMFFGIYLGFGTQVLLYSGAMSGISDSIIESAKLDGIKPMRELVSIVIPMIWQTFVTFMVVSIAGIFTNQMNLFSFYGPSAPYSLYTFGYFIYAETLKSGVSGYPYLSAWGLLMTVVAVPLTLFVRWALDKFGPKMI